MSSSLKPNKYQPLSFISASRGHYSPPKAYQTTSSDTSLLNLNSTSHRYHASMTSIKEPTFTSTRDMQNDTMNPSTALHSLHTLHETKGYSLNNSFSPPKYSQSHTIEYDKPSFKTRPVRVPVKSVTLEVKVEEADIDMDEFPDGPKTMNYHNLLTSKTPLYSSNVRTLSEVIEVNSPVNRVTPTASPGGKAKKFIFPEASSKVAFRSFDLGSPHASDLIYRPLSRPSRNKDVLLNLGILKIITNFLTCGDVIHLRSLLFEYRNEKRYKQIFEIRMSILMMNGLSKPEQYYFWDSLINFRKIKEAHPLAFTSQFVKDCKFVKDINKDLDRTLPEYGKYSKPEGKDALLKVLVAVSHAVKDVGYIQGLNTIAGVYLFYLNEERSFWIMIYMMEKLKVKNILKQDFQSVHVLNYQLQTFLQNYLPEVSEFLKKGTVDISYYTTPWFITLFSYFLSLENIIKTWNLFFIKGDAFLIQLGLAVLSKYKNTILSMDVDEVGSFFRYDLRTVSEKDDSLFKEALKFHVPTRLMVELEKFYYQGKPKAKLVRDRRNKLQWEVIYPQMSPTHKRERPIHIEGSFTDDKNIASISELKVPERPKLQAQKSREFVFNVVESVKTNLPEAFKNIFGKSPSNNASPTMGVFKTEMSDIGDISPYSNQYSQMSPQSPTKISRPGSPKKGKSLSYLLNDPRMDFSNKNIGFSSNLIDDKFGGKSPSTMDKFRQTKKLFQIQVKEQDSSLHREDPRLNISNSQPKQSFNESPTSSSPIYSVLMKSVDNPYSLRPQSTTNYSYNQATHAPGPGLYKARSNYAAPGRQSINSSQYNITHKFNFSQK